MKKIIIAVLLFLGEGALAFANSNGTIDFSGKLVNSTCDVSVNSYSNGNSATVTLAPTPAQNLYTTGKTAGLVTFSFLIQYCNGRPSFKAYFENGPSVDVDTGRLNNTRIDDDAAKNVQLQLLESSSYNNKPIFIGSGNQRTSSFYGSSSGDGSLISYAVRYYATGQVQPGLVTSDVVYTLIYP